MLGRWLDKLASRRYDSKFREEVLEAFGGMLSRHSAAVVENDPNDRTKVRSMDEAIVAIDSPTLRLRLLRGRGDVTIYGAPADGRRGWCKLDCSVPIPATYDQPSYYRDPVTDDLPILASLLDARWGEFAAEVNRP